MAVSGPCACGSNRVSAIREREFVRRFTAGECVTTFSDGSRMFVSTLPIDPFDALRAEAKRKLAAGFNPRVVLGALDECVRAKDPTRWAAALAVHATMYAAGVIVAAHTSAAGTCYHGNRPATCGWCALGRKRSDASVCTAVDPAWDAPDCEGE